MPLRGRISTRPSAASLFIASLTGVRLTPQLGRQILDIKPFAGAENLSQYALAKNLKY